MSDALNSLGAPAALDTVSTFCNRVEPSGSVSTRGATLRAARYRISVCDTKWLCQSMSTFVCAGAMVSAAADMVGNAASALSDAVRVKNSRRETMMS
jgi:hypothetical protein